MRRVRGRGVPGGGLWGALGLLLACLLLEGTAAAAALSPVKLALVVPMAGEAGRVGQSMRQAAELALADRAERVGRKVDLLVREDQFDPRQAAILARKLVKEEVWGVIGHFYSSSSIPAARIYAEAGIPQITATATHPELSAQGHPGLFRIAGRDDQQAATMAEFALGRLKVRRIALVHDRTEYGKTLVEAFRQAVERRRPRAVVFAGELAQGDKRFPELVAAITEARPEAVFYGGIYREAGLLLKQLRQAGLRAPFLGGDGVPDPEFVKLAEEPALLDVYLTFMPDPRRLPSAAPVIARYEAKYGPLGPYVLYTYDAVGAYLWGLAESRPAEATPAELAKLAKFLHTHSYPGTLGRLSWDARGDRAGSPYVVYQVKQGGSLQGWFEPLPPEAAGSKGGPPRRP